MNRERFLYWKFEKLYSKEEVDILNKEIESLKSEGSDIPAEDVVKTAEIKVIDSSKITLLNKMTDSIVEANKNNFGYNIYTEKYHMNYNTYSAKNKGRYDYHLDMVFQNPASDIKLTAILNLSTERYDGGNLCMYTGKEFAIPEIRIPGNMVVFPSFLLHKVKPVIAGTRKTLSVWVSGPKFQ